MCINIHTGECITIFCSLLALEILKTVSCIFLDSLKMAKVAATFETGWMFPVLAVSRI